MARVTSKLQVTIPKAIADRFGIRPGDDLDWVPAGEAIRVVPAGAESVPADPRRRLELFDAATARQQARDEVGGQGPRSTAGRGWRREDLYERGRAG